MEATYAEGAHKELLIESWSSTARDLLIRGFADGGPFAEEHTTNGDRSRAADVFQLHGMPEGVQVSPLVAPVRRGETYIRVSLMMDGEPVQRLLAGYLTDGKTLSWPGTPLEGFTDGKGLIRTITGTNPAAGAEVSEVVPTNAFWVLRAITLSLVAAAGGAARLPNLLFDDGATEQFRIASEFTVAATLSASFQFIGGFPTPSTNGRGISPMQADIRMFQAYRVRTSTDNLAGADDYGAPILVVEEWLQE